MESQLCERNEDEGSSNLSNHVREYIPHEIVDNILARLPCKSLARFKLVNKKWRSWLKNPDFQRRDSQSVLSISTSSDFRFFQTITEKGNQTEMLPVPWDDLKPRVYVSNSCDGMVLISVGISFYLFNPSTHYFVKVLTLNYMNSNNSGRIWDIYIGFYYDEVISDYKAVVLICFSRSANILVEASLKEKEWSHIDNPFKNYERVTAGPVVNGRLHWLAEQKIFRFDPVLNAFEELPSFQPPLDHKKRYAMVGLGVLDGFLSVSRVVKFDLEILTMKEYGVSESWTPMVTFSNENFIRIFDNLNPLLVSRAGGILISMKNEIWMYNLTKKSFKKLRTPENAISNCSVSFVQNMNTLIDVYDWNQTEHENFGRTKNPEKIIKFWREMWP